MTRYWKCVWRMVALGGLRGGLCLIKMVKAPCHGEAPLLLSHLIHLDEQNMIYRRQLMGFFIPQEQGHNFGTTVSPRNNGSLTMLINTQLQTLPCGVYRITQASAFIYSRMFEHFGILLLVSSEKDKKKILKVLRGKSLDYFILVIRPDYIWGTSGKVTLAFFTRWSVKHEV